MSKEPMHKKLYKDSPKLKREDASGKMAVHKEKNLESEKVDKAVGTEVPPDGLPMDVRHAHERRDMHNRHETEHAMHKGDKKEVHIRHQTEMKDMHKRHEKAYGAEAKGSGENKIEKVEKSKE
jgi:hypothetical protein